MTMMLMMALAMGGRREAVTQTFSTNTTWTAPAGVTMLTTLTGKGAAGTPSSTREEQYTFEKITRYKTAGGTDVLTFTHSGWDQYTEGCSWYSDDGIYYQYEQCFTHLTRTVTTSATTGASTTGFGKTFPGGVGGPASPATYNNIAVTPGASYSLVVPAGGSITISYLQ